MALDDLIGSNDQMCTQSMRAVHGTRTAEGDAFLFGSFDDHLGAVWDSSGKDEMQEWDGTCIWR